MKQNKVVAIIQARMASTRLPGKVLKNVNNKSILEIVISRVKMSRRISSIVVATTEKKEDDKIVDIARKCEVDWYRGSENDVLKRFVDASKMADARTIVRITADNPLTDPELIDDLIKAHLKSEADYSHSVGTPLGIGAEVVNKETLEKINFIVNAPEDREHVTLYIKEHPEFFKIQNIKAEAFGLNYPNIRLTVDTEEDLELMRSLHKNLGDLEKLKIKGVIEFLNTHPELSKINAHIKQKIPKLC